jgi:hypothetical protein
MGSRLLVTPGFAPLARDQQTQMTAMTSLRFNDAPSAHDSGSHFVMPGAAGVISSFLNARRHERLRGRQRRRQPA